MNLLIPISVILKSLIKKQLHQGILIVPPLWAQGILKNCFDFNEDFRKAGAVSNCEKKA